MQDRDFGKKDKREHWKEVVQDAIQRQKLDISQELGWDRFNKLNSLFKPLVEEFEVFQDEVNRICIQNWAESSVYDVALDEALLIIIPIFNFG